ESFLKAIDYRTGKVRWRHAVTESGMSLLSTAGDLLFGGDGAGNFVAYDPATGDPLWHAGLLANPSNAPAPAIGCGTPACSRIHRTRLSRSCSTAASSSSSAPAIVCTRSRSHDSAL